MHKIAPSFWHCSLPKGKATGGRPLVGMGAGWVSLLHIK